MCKTVSVVAAFIRQGDRFLICQRPAYKVRGLQWEFVGGKVEQGESLQQALVRECFEELDIIVSPKEIICTAEYGYPDMTLRLTIFEAEIVGGTLKKKEHSDIRWITREEIVNYRFSDVDYTVINEILNLIFC